MALNRPTLTDLVDRIATDISSNITGVTTLALRSVLRVLGRVYAGAIHLVYGYIDNVTKQLFASTASTAYLNMIGSEYGIIRIAAIRATGAIAVIGVDATVIPAGSELQNAAGYKYTTDAEATIASGTATVNVTAVVAGIASNDSAGVTLTFTSPIIDITSATTVDSTGIIGGADEESDTDYRTRILTRKRKPPHGGATYDYVAWAKEVAGVTRVWVISAYQGAGTLAVYFVRDDDASIYPDATELQTVKDYIISHNDPASGLQVGIPVTAEPGLFVLAPTPNTVNFSIGIYPNNATIQAAITAQLQDLFLREGGPGQTIYLSEIREAISLATDEARHSLTSPVADISALTNEVHVVGTITYSDY